MRQLDVDMATLRNKEATTDADRIGRWWHCWPQANVGLATGIVFDALDIDGPAGLAALQQPQAAAGLPLPPHDEWTLLQRRVDKTRW
jgi:hypothetical protein